jgi:hypothetical protein
MNKSEKGINNRQASNAAKVLILGSGFGGLFTLQRLLNNLADNDNLEITMVSDENYFLFSPLLHEVATGGIETRHITYPIRRLEQKRKFLFIQDEVRCSRLASSRAGSGPATGAWNMIIWCWRWAASPTCQVCHQRHAMCLL